MLEPGSELLRAWNEGMRESLPDICRSMMGGRGGGCELICIEPL